MFTMKEAHIDADTNVTLHDVPIPELMDPHQIVIKVVVAGCNPKDWKMPAGMLVTIGSCPNSGDDVAGVYHPNSGLVRDSCSALLTLWSSRYRLCCRLQRL
jgi:hypothetical protein